MVQSTYVELIFVGMVLFSRAMMEFNRRADPGGTFGVPHIGLEATNIEISVTAEAFTY